MREPGGGSHRPVPEPSTVGCGWGTLAEDPERQLLRLTVYDSALKRKRWVGTFKTMREARARVTCGEYVQLWLAEYGRPTPATRRSYRYALQRFAQEFDRRRLAEFDRLTARAWANVHPAVERPSRAGDVQRRDQRRPPSGAEPVREPAPRAVARPQGFDRADRGRAARAGRHGAACAG